MAQQALLYPSAHLITGSVIAIPSPTSFTVLVDGARYCANVAASCLLQPQELDVVLLACLEDGSNCILAILYRDAKTPAMVTLPEQTTLSCPGSLTVRSAEKLHMQSAKAMHLATEELDVTAHNATAHVSQINTIAHTVKMCCQTLNNIGTSAIFAFKSMTQCFDKSQKMVTDTDETHCTNSTTVAKETSTVMSTNDVRLVKEIARTDAKLIHLG